MISLPHLALVLVGLSSASTAHAADGFEKVRCDQPILPALIGARTSGSEPVVRIEARRKAIGLQNLGADEIGNGVNAINWRICDRSFVVLDIRNVWQDAVELPSHSRDAPAFSTTSCVVGGRVLDGTFLGVFAKAAKADSGMLPVKAAWRIDRRRKKFVPLDAGATCATDGIYTQDAP